MNRVETAVSNLLLASVEPGDRYVYRNLLSMVNAIRRNDWKYYVSTRSHLMNMAEDRPVVHEWISYMDVYARTHG